MTFLVPIALLGLLALAVPLVLHLIKRSEVREMDWAAMEFLEEREVKSVSRKSLDNIPLLLARMGIVAFLVLALARPVGNLLNWKHATPDTVFVLLDRSPEMAAKQQNGVSFLQQGILDVQIALEDFPESVRVYLLDSASLSLTPVLSPNYLSLLPQAEMVGTSCSIPQMLLKGGSEYQQGDFGKTEFWLVASNAQSSWMPDRKATSPEVSVEGVTVRSFVYDTDVYGDLQIDYIGASAEKNEVTIELEITGAEPGQVVSLNGEWNTGEKIEDELSIEAGQTRYTLGLLSTAGAGSGFIELPSDANVENDRVYFSYGPPLDTYTALVTDEEESKLTDYLKRSVALSSRPHQKVKWISSEHLPLTDLSQYNLLIWAASDESIQKRTVIEQYVTGGGQSVVFPSPDAESHDDGWFFGEVEEAPLDEFFSITTWNEKAGPWKNAENSEALPLAHLQGVLMAHPESETDSNLAVWSNDIPALSQNRLGEGSVYLVSSLPIPTWSNMENLALHLILFQRLLEEEGTVNVGGYSKRLVSGEAPYSAELSTVDGGRVVAVNRAVPTSRARISEVDQQQLMKDYNFNELAKGKRPMRPWLYPFLVIGLTFFLLEAVLQVFKKNRWFLRNNKEVKNV